MTQRNDGGAAFPRSGFSGPAGFGKPEDGMSLRDAAALAMLPTVYTQAVKDAIEDGNPVDLRNVALDAYDLAEAFVAARERT